MITFEGPPELDLVYKSDTREESEQDLYKFVRVTASWNQFVKGQCSFFSSVGKRYQKDRKSVV